MADLDAPNPFLVPWGARVPFEQINVAHIRDAFAVAIERHDEAIAQIVREPTVTFDNTVAAFDRSGELLSRVVSYVGNLTAAHTTPELDALDAELSPRIARHNSNVALNRELFLRIEHLVAHTDSLGLSPVDRRLLERVHSDFVRGGARFEGAERVRVGAIAEELAALQTQFMQNTTAEEGSWTLPLNDNEYGGLPDWWIAAAKQSASERGLSVDVPVATLSRSMIVPFLTYAENRDAREKAWRAWSSRGDNQNDRNNHEIVRRIVRLRAELAALHGFRNFAGFQLDDRMAKTAGNVDQLLQQTWTPARSAAIRDSERLTALARNEGVTELEPWDWWHYAEMLRASSYDIGDQELQEFITLDNCMRAIFGCAQKLFGLHFVERPHEPSYQADVRTFDVFADTTRVGVFLVDNYARPNKQSGAWMCQYRIRSHHDGNDQAEGLPIVGMQNNFAKGKPGEPVSLSTDDALTMFHEFGHSLHGLLSTAPYERLYGTNTLLDFVELPSQLFEHWFWEAEVLREHMISTTTGLPISDDLIERLRHSREFNQGFETVSFLSSALMDMALHCHPNPEAVDLNDFERETLSAIGMPPAIMPRHRLPHFAHLFASSHYAAGYYAYLWAEVLDADAFDAFTEAGNIFDPETASRLRTNVYEPGDSIEPGLAYRQFRGKDPSVEPMLRLRGLLEV